nr:hypothetical protein [Achromobacter sp. Root83]
MARADLRQSAARLYAAADRRRAGPALGPHQGAARLSPTRHIDRIKEKPCNVPPPCPPCRSTTNWSPSPNGAFRRAGKPAGIATA